VGQIKSKAADGAAEIFGVVGEITCGEFGDKRESFGREGDVTSGFVDGGFGFIWAKV